MHQMPDDEIIAKGLCGWHSPVLFRCVGCNASIWYTEGVKCQMALPRKSENGQATGLSGSPVLPGKLFAEYSSLWEFLTLSHWPDGKKRRTGRLSLSCDVGGLRLSLSDEETGLYASINGATVDDLLLLAEVALRDATMAWRVSQFGRPKRS
jgi:hypothetical protein